jgi:hypothetical protein
LDRCFFVVVVVVVAGLLVAGVEVELLVDFPPHPATASVAAIVASSVSMAASDVRFIGRSPVFARGFDGPPTPGGPLGAH